MPTRDLRRIAAEAALQERLAALDAMPDCVLELLSWQAGDWSPVGLMRSHLKALSREMCLASGGTIDVPAKP